MRFTSVIFALDDDNNNKKPSEAIKSQTRYMFCLTGAI